MLPMAEIFDAMIKNPDIPLDGLCEKFGVSGPTHSGKISETRWVVLIYKNTEPLYPKMKVLIHQRGKEASGF